MNLNNFLQSKGFKIGLALIAGLIVLLCTFRIGMFVGYKRAGFSYRWGENYHRNFAGPRGGFFMDFSDRNFINPHGNFATIIKIDGATLVIKGDDKTEKTVIVSADTDIRSGRDAVKSSDLKVNDRIVVIGNPNEKGQIEAKLIRLFR